MKKIISIEASVIEQSAKTGVGYFTVGLAKGLSALPNKGIIINYFWLNFLRKKKAQSKIVQIAEKEGRLQQIVYIPQRLFAKLVFYRLALPLFTKQASWELYPNFYIWPTTSRAKKAVVIHDLCYKSLPEFVEDKNRMFLSHVADRSMQKADLIISISAFTTSEILKYTNVPKEKIVTIGIPVDTEDLKPNLNKGAGRLSKRYGINKPYILSLATLEPRKNLDTLVEAYCALPKNLRDTYSLVLAGKWGWKIDATRERIEKRRSEGFDIITTGYIDMDDKATFLYNASLYATTSHYEGFGMQILEAMHCGIPTLSSNIPVHKEVGGDACAYTDLSISATTDQLKKLLSDPELRKRLTQEGKKRSKNFRWDTYAQRIYDRMF